MIIRCYQLKDEHAILDLWHKCNIISASNNPKRDIQRKLAIDPHLFLVSELDHCIIASVMAGYEGHRGWINYLAVAPHYQHQGIGTKLMFEIENRLKHLGCPKINLQIRSSNQDVIRFYQKLGFSNDKVISLGKRLIEENDNS